jgi:dipeptidyl aminopeptidase/acylaminoacyl peptidase
MLDLGTGLNRLSDVSPLEAGDAWLSPDWQRLATIEPTGASSPPQLVVQRLDGSERHVLSDTAYWPVAWSPDGKRLAFDRQTNSGLGDLFTIAVDGSGLTKIAEQAVEPSWSPDGQQIAFRQRTGPSRADVVIANADASNPRVLTAALSDSHMLPTWSPNGKTIASLSLSSAQNIEFTEVATGSTRRFLTQGFPNGVPVSFSWSPDSRKLIYSANLTDATTAPPAVFRIDLSTDEQDLVVQSGSGARYSPDGSQIAYAAVGDCPSAGVYVLGLTAGSATQRRLTNDCHAAPAPEATVSVTPSVVEYGGTVTLRGWFPPGSATARVRLVEFQGPPCTPTAVPAPITLILESVNGNWSYRFKPCSNDAFNIYSDTALTGARVRVAPRVRLASLGRGRFDFTATAAARLGDNVAFVELRSHGHWVRIRRFRLTDRSIGTSSFTAGREFVLHLAHRSRIRVFMPYPILNGNVYGAYAPVTSNAVTG